MAGLVVQAGNMLVKRTKQEHHIEILRTNLTTAHRNSTSNKEFELRQWETLTSGFHCVKFEDIFKNLDDIICFRDIVALKEETTTQDNALKWRIYLISIIANCIMDYLEFLTRRNTMNAEQVKQTSMLIFDEFPLLTVPDLVLFNRLCKLGHFGELKDLNGTVLILWLKKYFEERRSELNEFYFRQEELNKKELPPPEEKYLTPEENEERWKTLMDSMKDFGKPKKVIPKIEPTKQQKIERIRLKVIRENTHLLQDPSTYEEKMNNLIEQAIAQAGLHD